MRARLLATAACLVVAAVAALGAADAGRWRDAVDDVRGREPVAKLPGDPVGRVAAIEDDLAYRRALRNFVVAEHVPWGFDNGELRATVRTRAAGALATVAENGEPRLASRANDLLGVLAATDGAVDTARDRFQAAILADPTNVNAKRNLETLLRVLDPFARRPGPVSGSGPRGGRGAGSSAPGTGY